MLPSDVTIVLPSAVVIGMCASFVCNFATRCNRELVGFDPIEKSDAATIEMLVTEHLARTGSTVAAGILADTHAISTRFVKVMPHDYKRALADLEIERDDHPVSTGGGGFFTAETEEGAR